VSTSSAPVDPTLHPTELEREPEGDSLRDYASRWWAGVRGGELGSLPIFVGMVIIVIVFQAQNANFLTAGNLLNLVIQAAAIMTIAMGVVFVLLLGEIDLSVGYVSGVGGAIAALLTLPGGNWEFAGLPAVIVVLIVGLLIGALNGLLFTKIGIPSFVVTLAGLLPGTASCW
jgi:D-xylose transport system permease protein